MVIALIGYGKMGKAVEKAAIEKGHEVVIASSSRNDGIRTEPLSKSDVVIEFTRPDAAVQNLLNCLDHAVPVVCGTTGWYESYDSVKTRFVEKKGALFTASNFSIGMNLVFELNNMLSRWTSHMPEYHPSILETHHLQKLDKPSGTAITLANGISHNHSKRFDWKLQDDKAILPDNILPIYSFREEHVVGTHEVKWRSEIDEITLRHEAFTREGFAHGAISAAEWLVDKIGVFGMRDMLFEKQK
jgi:4-hydroxy-tetrahydrodipicolinate reductase